MGYKFTDGRTKRADPDKDTKNRQTLKFEPIGVTSFARSGPAVGRRLQTTL